MLLDVARTSPKRLPKFIKRQPLLTVLFTWVFVLSSLIISLLCIVATVIWPFSKSIYRRLVTKLAYSIMGQMIWMCIDFADVRVTVYGEESALEKLGKESCLITMSHLGEFDWLIGLMLADNYGFLTTVRSFAKKSIEYVPGIGQMLWAMEYPFLDRSWSKDKKKIKKSLQTFKDFPIPIQVVIFCEGTRFTQDKFLQGVEYAKTTGLTPLKYHLVPRTKGYATVAHSLKHEANFPASYDIGIAYPKGQTYLNGKHMTLRDLLSGQQLEIMLYLRYIPMEQVPSDTVEDLQEFCHNLYVHKDQAYDHFVREGVYPSPSRPLVFSDSHIWFLRINQLFWALLLCVLPICWLWWQIIVVGLVKWAAMMFGLGFIGTAIISYGLLMYSQQTHSKNR